jgi:MFS family permease
MSAARDTTSDVRTGEAPYTQPEKRKIIAAASFGWGLEFFDLQLLALSGAAIIAEFGISTAQLGAAFTTQLVATALGGVLFGWLADLYGRRRVLTWTIWVFAVSTAAVAFVPSFGWLLVLRFITGLGTGGEWAVGFSLLNEAWTPKRRGLAGGLVQASLWPAFALAIFVTGAVSDWRHAFLIGLFPAAFAIWVRLRCPESRQWEAMRALRMDRSAEGRPSAGTLAREAARPLREIFGRNVVRITVVGTLVVFGAQYSYYVYSSWMPVYLTESLGFSPEDSRAILYAGAAISFVTYIAAGALGDIWGRRNALLSFAAVQLVAFGAFAILNATDAAPAPIVASYLVISFGLGYFGIFGVWFGELFSTPMRATGSAFCYSVGRGLASFGPTVVGVLAANYGLGGGISTGVAAVLLMMVLALLLEERRGRVITATD